MTSPDDGQAYLKAWVELLPTEAGGRPLPIRSGYMPNWWVPGTDDMVLASAGIELVEGEFLAPGGRAAVRIYPFAPEIWQCVGVGTVLNITEGPKHVVGAATVTRVVPAAVPVS